ncbi:MAG: O-acetyl-ADP-ribose deacetylase [Elusimicrobia bacterium]|nr:O-acetyl-ADP-ribose deacetylase [Elusimicrobiota bacterium]
MEKRISLVREDITKMSCDAIVNAANKTLLGGGGVDGAIHRVGGKAILKECMEIGGCEAGEAVITGGGKLQASYVIHTVGPIWRGGKNKESELLKNCYLNSLKLAVKNGVKTLAFSNISTGVYGFPKRKAAHIAISTVRDFLSTDNSIEKIIFVCFDEENYQIYKEILK